MDISLQNKIQSYIKSGIDINELIKNQDIRNLDLSYALISDFNVSKQDISGCRLVCAKIQKAQMIHTIARNVQFNYADMTDANISYIDARDSNFLNANCTRTIHKYADLRGCNFCKATITLGPEYGYMAKVSGTLLSLLDRIWDVTIT